MTTVKVDVAPDVLRWARESNGLSLDEAAKKLRIGRIVLELWEEGAPGEEPTLAQLRNLARVYKRPLAVLLLAEPPSGFDVLRDFRLLSAGSDRPWSPALHAEFRRVQTQREVASELAALVDDPPTQIDFEVRPTNDPDRVAVAIREWLGMPFRNADGRIEKHEVNEWSR